MSEKEVLVPNIGDFKDVEVICMSTRKTNSIRSFTSAFVYCTTTINTSLTYLLKGEE